MSLAASRQEASIAAGLSHARYARALGRLEWGTSRNFRKFLSGPSGEHLVTFESFSRDLPPLIKKRAPELHLVTFESFSRDLPPLIKKLWGMSFQSSKISPNVFQNLQTLTKIAQQYLPIRSKIVLKSLQNRSKIAPK